ncbi:SpoIIE family protein phosphatase [Streptomyces sp. 3MP-14]|uniref:SpoIIE family protein phosphatase n=1 Tax=Streptomyces mimosae TaxID=2586635 RepID=A0A5N6AB02_9ACTN|nr:MULTISPECIES: SpoIIE family protein phosphatase [Streptomyces]KAB8165821.1 SpoIIE family protein phosphatase [Streptomyces mimosae]KAB8176210.1 SpoIIE family protein phosphatase [Streptomyces sp. 3MP-14]
MTASTIDYAAVYRAYPSAVALLTPELRYVEANEAYLKVAGRQREDLLGRRFWEVFPDNPEDDQASGTTNLRRSLERVAATGERDPMAIQRYDVESEEESGEFTERYWSIVNGPVFDEDGRVRLILHRVEEVTELIKARGEPLAPEAEDRARRLESDLLTRAGELQGANERLREAHAKERQVGLALQRSMLPAPDLKVKRDSAVRYRPASAAMNVCGDWYDIIDLDGDRITLAVGDVVGHGLEAAGVMGQLRSALSAVARVSESPGRALSILDLYARSVPGAQTTTVVKLFVDWETHVLVYSSAGHLPPALARCDGRVDFLDQATNPPLAVLPTHAESDEASVPFESGDVLALYTDGLIERRDEDIDQGLARLAASLERHRAKPAEALADSLLVDLLPPKGTEDDTALVILRL